MLLVMLFGFLKYFAWMLFLRFLVKNDKLAAVLFAIEFAGIAIALDFYDLEHWVIFRLRSPSRLLLLTS